MFSGHCTYNLEKNCECVNMGCFNLVIIAQSQDTELMCITHSASTLSLNEWQDIMKEEGKYGRKEKKNKANEVKTEQGQEDVEIKNNT